MCEKSKKLLCKNVALWTSTFTISIIFRANVLKTSPDFNGNRFYTRTQASFFHSSAQTFNGYVWCH